MSYLKDREIWLSKVPTGNPPAGFFWKFIRNGKVVVRDSSGNDQMMIATNGSQAITGSLIVTGGITGTISSASYVQYSNVANKPTLVSGSGQISFNGITNKPTLVSGSSQVTFLGLSSIPSGIVSGSSQVTYSGLTGIPSGIVSGSAQVAQFGYATTGANGFNGSQSITGSLTVTGQVIAQTLNVQQVTSSIVFSSGSNVFGNNSGNTHRFTGSVNITGSLSVNGALSGASATFSGNVTSDDLILTAGTLFGTGNTGFSNRSSDTTLYLQMPATGFNITDNALNTRFILSSAGAITSQTTGNNGIINIGGSTYYSQLETNSTLGGLKIKSVWGAANSGIIQFINGTSENIRMHIADNGNVDVGLTNATDRLTISRNVADNAGGITLYNAETSGYGSALTFRVNYAGVYNVSRIHGDWGTGNSGLLHFFTANTSQTLVERMLIDGSGNVGIGTVSPVANDGTSRTLQVGNRLVIQNVIGTQFLLGTNAYYDGVSWKYIAAVKAQAVRGTGESGAIQFSLSPTGTVGGTITNMDGSDIKMIILDTGNVGIGTTTPADKLEIKSGYLRMYDPSSGANAGYIIQWSSNNGGTNVTYAGIDGITTSAGNRTGDLRFLTSNAGAPAEKMRITSGGNVGIGTASPPSRLSVQWDKSTQFAGAAVYDSQVFNASDHGGTLAFGGTYNSAGTYTEWSAIGGMKSNTTDGNVSGDINFYTRLNSSAMTERMKITSGGEVSITGINLTVGTGGGAGTLNLDQSTVRRWKLSAGGITSGVFTIINGSDDSPALNISSANVVSFYLGGGFANQTTLDENTRFQGPNISVAAAKAYAWNTYSDHRIKENINPLSYGLSEILQLNPVSYNQHDSEVIDGEVVLKETYKPTIGLIAQEVNNLIPEAVGVGNDTELWGLDYDKLIPVLVKAIQEQQTLIESLKSRIEILEQ